MKNTILNDVSIPLVQPASINIDIQGINEPVICEYFERLNNGEFTATAELFAEQGYLNPPFDKQLQDRDAITQYLEQEAQGITFFPESGAILMSDAHYTQYQIQGKVELNWFTVNISWSITLSAAKEIMSVDVKLLASLDDLLSFSRI
jgi:uncharacterized protein YozE (UPF0346 family)